nr:MAG TPA: tail tape measure protein [Caudoviricetes sp.]
MAETTSRLVLEIDSSGVRVASANLDKFTEAAAKSARSADSLDSFLSRLSPSSVAAAAGLASVLVAYKKITGAMASFVTGAMSSYAAFEQIESGLQGVLKSADRGTEMFEELRKFSNETTFGVDTLANAASQLLSVGESESGLKRTLLEIGNIANGDTNRFNELVSIYAKIQNVGKAGSEQLQQLALRGVPIYQYLKKIGVQGTATGDDIKKAFQEMTKQGETFYGTMERINNTVSGKEGFVADYFKEASVLFVEATGLGDMYKGVLDLVQDALGGVVEWLKEVKDNPVYSALLKGAIAASLVALTAGVGVGLVGAVKKLNRQLAITAALKAAINPTAIAIAGVAAALAGTGVALASYIKAGKDENAVLSSQNKLIETQIDLRTRLANLPETLEERKKLAEELHDYLAKQEKTEVVNVDYKSNANNVNSLRDSIFAENGYTSTSFVSNENQKRLIEAYKELYKITVLANQQKAIFDESSLSKSSKSLDENVKILQEYEDALSTLKGYDTPQNKYETQLSEIEAEFEKLDKLKEQKKEIEESIDENGVRTFKYAVAIDVDKDYKQKFDDVYNYWQQKKFTLQFDHWKDGLSDLQKAMIKVFSFDDSDLKKLWGTGFTKNTAASLFVDKNKSVLDRRDEAYRKAGFKTDEKTSLESLYTSIREKFDEAINEGNNAADGLVPLMNRYRQKLESLGTEFDETGRITQTLKEKMNYFAEFVGGLNLGEYSSLLGLGDAVSLVAQKYSEGNSNGGSTDVAGAFASAFSENGELMISSLAAVANMLLDFMQTLEGADYAFSVVTQVLEALEDGLQKIVDVFAAVTQIFVEMAEVFAPIISLVGSLIKIGLYPLIAMNNILLKSLRPIINLLNVVIEPIGKFSDWLYSFLGISYEVNEERQSELERIRAANDAYKALYSAIKEQEEYYLTKKAQVNADTYSGKITGVNDMILTPHGTFSTSPHDTLIAMKRPEMLMSGGVSGGVSVTINNYSNSEVQTRQDDYGNLIVDISKKIAEDYANGDNGWARAYSTQQSTVAGRRVSI